MACFVLNIHNWEISIPTTENVQGITVYDVIIRIGLVQWLVKHRYKDFAELHDVLVSEHSVSKDILPPKKVLGNRDPDFVEKRRVALENYLTYIVKFLQKTMPKKLVLFLSLEKYDIMFLLQKMSTVFVDGGSSLLSVSKSYCFNVIEVHAISERMKLPCPPLEMFGMKHDFSNILEFCGQLETVSVTGDNSTYKNSNIDFSKLPFELSAFKSLQNLVLQNLRVENLTKANDLRAFLKSLRVVGCGVKNLSEIVLCDELHKEWWNAGQEKIWTSLLAIDLSNNEIEVLDGIKLMPYIQALNLSTNRIREIARLEELHNLQRLYLSCNRICELGSLYLQLKCIKFIDLSQNQISSLKGLEQLDTLQGFNLASNLIKELDQVLFVSSLPQLEYIVLTGNPISTLVDYRVKVLEKFGTRYCRICLDNEQSTQKELDTVAVLQALRAVKEGKPPTFRISAMT